MLQGRNGLTDLPIRPEDSPPLVGFLPRPPVALIGRDQDLDRTSAFLLDGNARLLTLIGPAGVGKTSLALELSGRVRSAFRHGVWFVDLSAERDGNAVLSAVSKVLGVAERGHGLLMAYLGDRELLLLLDNLEQIPDAASAVSTLLSSGQGIRVLATSRQALHLRAERRFPIKPLEVGETSAEAAQSPAVKLFLARALESNPDYRLTPENAEDLTRLCLRLDGLPLALELAASRADTLSATAILAYLESHSGVPWVGASDSPERHRSLQAALDWSFDLLDESHKILLRRLGVFAGSFDVESVAAVAGTAALGLDALLALAELCDRSLLIPVPRGDETRFRLLVTVRDYALERLEAAGELEEIRVQHTNFFLGLGEELQRRGATDTAAMARVDLENENMDEALRWVLAQPMSSDQGSLAYRLVSLRAAYWSVRGRLLEARRWYEATLVRLGADQPSLRARLMTSIASAATQQGDFQTARRLFEMALNSIRGFPTDESLGGVLIRYANLLNAQGELGRAVAAAEEGLEVIRRNSLDEDLIGALATLASVILDQGQPERSEVLVREALLLAQRTGQGLLAARMQGFLAATIYFQGDSQRSLLLFEEALAAFETFGDEMSIAQTTANFGDAYFSLGDLDRARALFERSVELSKRTNTLRNLPDVMTSLALLALAQGRTEEAAHRLLEVVSSTDIHPRQISNALCGVAQLCAASHQPRLGAVMLGAAERKLETHGMTFFLTVRAVVDKVLSDIRSQLQPDELLQAWEEGRVRPFSDLLEVIRHNNFAVRVTPEPAERQKSIFNLSDRELEVLRLVAQGLSNKRVAQKLNLSDNTVKFHLTSVFNKLGCRTRAEATRIAVTQGLV